MNLSVVFPVHNEEGNLEELIARSNKTLGEYYHTPDPKRQDAFELILVDDASKDKSLEILKRCAAGDSHIVVIHHEQSRGQTGAFKSGFDAARGEVVLTMDSDLEVLPEDVPLFLDKMKEGLDIVNGIRVERKHENFVRLQSWAYNKIMRILFWSPFRDNASNFTAIRTELVKNLPLTDNDHRYLYPILRTRGLKSWGEVNVRHELRKSGSSKYSRFKAFKNAFEMMPVLFRIKTGYYSLQK